MSLSLVLRKNIRDATPTMTANLEKIREASGIDFVVEIDFAGVKAALPADNSYGDRLGECFYSYYLSPLANNVKRFCENPLQREAFIEHLSEKKTIRFVLTKNKLGGNGYSQTSDDQGVLLCTIPISNFCTNVDYLGSDLSTSLAGSGPLSLSQRKNIADYNEKLQIHLATINTATGIDFDVEIDWAEVAKHFSDSSYKDRLGEAFYDWYIGALARSLTKLCADELGKEAFVDRCGAKKTIRFTITEKPKDEHVYVYSDIPSDGTLVILVPKKKLCTNVDYTGADIEKLL